MAARGSARLPVRDGQRRALPAVHRRRAGGRRGAERRAHRGRPRRRLARASRPRARRRLAVRPADAGADGPVVDPRRRVLPSPSRDHARTGQGDRGRAAGARTPRRSRVGRPVRGRHAARLPPARDARERAGARCTRRPSCRSTRRARSSPWRSCTWTRATARGCSTSRRRCRSRPSTPARNGRRASSRRDPSSGGAEHRGYAPEEDHRRALPHRRDPAVEVLRPRAPGQADRLRLPGHQDVPQEPHGRVQGRAGPGDVQLRRAGPRAVV